VVGSSRMPATKKKPKIQGSDVEVGGRSLEAVLIDLAERSGLAEERAVRAEEQTALAFKSIASVHKDQMGISEKLEKIATQMQEANRLVSLRLAALEKGAGA
jgi:hypothetical protein